MKIWLDDLRSPPDASWTWVKSVAEAIGLMQSGQVEHASLDHDLGMDPTGVEVPAGRRLVYWMAETNCWPSKSISIHSANIVGVEYMVGMIKRYGPFEKVGGLGHVFRRAS